MTCTSYAKGTIQVEVTAAQIVDLTPECPDPARCRAADGLFEVTDWDTAFSEIGAKVADIRPRTTWLLAINQDSRTLRARSTRCFINALGSGQHSLRTARLVTPRRRRASVQHIGMGTLSILQPWGDGTFIGRGSYGDGILVGAEPGRRA